MSHSHLVSEKDLKHVNSFLGQKAWKFNFGDKHATNTCKLLVGYNKKEEKHEMINGKSKYEKQEAQFKRA